MKKPIDPNLERFEDSVFSLTGGDDTPGVSYRAPQFEMKETSAAAIVIINSVKKTPSNLYG